MEKVTIACVQQRNVIVSSQQEFESLAQRFIRLAQAKSAQLVIFPELAGLMLAPTLFSGIKRGFIKRADKGKQPGAGPVQRGVKRLADAAAGALGGYWGSMDGLLRKNSGGLWHAYVDTFGKLAQESGVIVVGGSLYVANQDALLEFPYIEGQIRIAAPGREVAKLPSELNHHWTKALVASPDGSRLYVGIGSNSNITHLSRSNAFFVYNAVSNAVQAPFCAQPPRPEFIATRSAFEPLRVLQNGPDAFKASLV